MSNDPQIKVTIYRFRNRLKDKVAGLIPPGEKVTIPKEALDAAQQAFEKMAEDYPDWVQGNIRELRDNVNLSIPAEKEERRYFFNKINEIAHNMKGQGGTFGYPLITEFADSLWSFTGEESPLSDNIVELIKAHTDTMNIVIKDRIKGHGGDLGKELQVSLQMAIEKHTKRDPDELIE